MSANGTASQLASKCACRGCGTTAPIATARVTGAWSVSGGQPQWACPGCTRAQLDEIEAGLNRLH